MNILVNANEQQLRRFLTNCKPYMEEYTSENTKNGLKATPKAHYFDSKTFAELSYREQSNSIKAMRNNLVAAIRAHIGRGKKEGKPDNTDGLIASWRRAEKRLK